MRLAIVLTALVLALVAGNAAFAAPAELPCQSVPAGADLDAAVNSDPASTPTRFCLAAGTYTVSDTLRPQSGDEITGPVGTFTQHGPSYEPNPTATIQAAPGVAQVTKPEGTVRLEWLRITGGTFTGQAGTGSGIAMGQASDDSLVRAVVIEHTEGAGITNAHGTIARVELTDNTTNPAAIGFIGSGLKAVDEVKIRRSYVHDEQAHGLWCDEGCDDTALGKFYVHDNYIERIGKEGVRYEKVGPDGGEALIEGNEIHGTLNSAVAARDSQNATITGNTFGGNKHAFSASDSQRSDRPDLLGIDFENNNLNGDDTDGCELPDAVVSVVYCANNTP